MMLNTARGAPGRFGVLIALLIAGVSQAAQDDAAVIERGRYLVQIAGCNDCHTPGYMEQSGNVPEEVWLTGDSFGWRGGWGTTYAANLRLRLQNLTQDDWLHFARNLKTRPPMPWFSLNHMHEQDLVAIYQYVRHLGPAGTAAPAFVPPDQEPLPPFALFPSPPTGN